MRLFPSCAGSRLPGWAVVALTSSLPFGIRCAAALSQGTTAESVELQRRKCLRSADYPPVRTAGDMKTRFKGILAGEAFQEYHPEVLSVDPMIIYFDTFMTEEEVARCEAQVDTLQFAKSQAGYGGKHRGRQSDTAFCLQECDSSAIVQTVQRRASDISGVPLENFDYTQALRYREGMYFQEHHDNHPTFNRLPCGTRIFSFFVYLSDAGLEGGATKFPSMNVSVPAKRGAAVLFANTKDDDPMMTDHRALHEGEPVTKGEKRGLNLWLYQYNYRHFWQLGCTSIEFADHLGELNKACEPGSEGEEAAPASQNPTVVFKNPRKTDLSIFWINAEGKEVLVDTVKAGQSASINSYAGHAFSLRTPQGKHADKYTVTSEPRQEVLVSSEGGGDL